MSVQSQSRFDTIAMEEIDRMHLTATMDRLHPVVLVVDDEAVIADTLTVILQQNKYAALTAYSAESALELAALIPPDLLISDVVMPGMNGIELAIAIKTSVPDCRVLLFSGQAGCINLLADAHEAGHDFTLLDKPIHPVKLLEHIAELGVKQEILLKV